MKVDIQIEIVDHQIMKFTIYNEALEAFRQNFPKASKAHMIHYMEKHNVVWCKTFHNFVNIGPIIQNKI